jgi:hypothetical protein
MTAIFHTATSLLTLIALGILAFLSHVRAIDLDSVTAISLFALYGCIEVGIQSYRNSRSVQMRLDQLPEAPARFTQQRPLTDQREAA